MVNAGQLMKKDIYTVREEEKVRDLLRVFVEKQVSGVPVLGKDHTLAGIITEADILRQIHQPPSFIDFVNYFVVLDSDRVITGQIMEMLDRPVKDLMTKDVITVDEETSLAKISQILSRRKFKKLPVVDGQKLVGVINRSDVIGYLVKEFLLKKTNPSF